MPLKARIKRMIGRALSVDWLEKLTEYAVAEQAPEVSLEAARRIDTGGADWTTIVERGREQLWRETIAALPGDAVLLLEFGVWQGESMAHFLALSPSPKSRFIGFDSFEGLPEDWRGMAAERFDVGGAVPRLDDPRLHFVKGWFRETLPPMLDELAALAEGRTMLVHFDADLYSSTLFLLFTLASRFARFHFIFDEFSGHETRALYNFMQATGARARFSHRLDWQGCPQVVSGELLPPD